MCDRHEVCHDLGDSQEIYGVSTVTLVLLWLYSQSIVVHLDYYMYSNDVMSNATCNVNGFSTICRGRRGKLAMLSRY